MNEISICDYEKKEKSEYEKWKKKTSFQREATFD